MVYVSVMVYLNNVGYSHRTVESFYTVLSSDTPLLNYNRQMQLF